MSEDHPKSRDNYASLMEIYHQCNRKVGIVYNDRGFFGPRLLSINHLSVGRSRIISSRITILLEYCYRQYMRLRDSWRRLRDILFPKNLEAPVHHTGTDGRLVGRITFAGRRDFHTPVHNVRVVFWARTWLLQWRKIAEGVTDLDGAFDLPFALVAARGWSVMRRRFEIYQTSYGYDESGKRFTRHVLFQSQVVPGIDLTGMRYNLRTIPIYLWEYREGSTVPRAAIKDHDRDAPEYYSQGRIDAMDQQLVPIELTKLKHLEQIARDPGSLTIDDIQRDYPPNLTVCMERREPGITRGDTWFGLRMMNGMYAATFVPDETDPGHYLTRFYGACTYQTNDRYAFPSVEVKFVLDDRGIMLPREIRLVGRLAASDASPWQRTVVTPDDGDRWLQAKRVARVTGALSTELDDHFTGTHLVAEQFAIAAFRNLRLSPIAALLFPHLKEVALINHSADSVLIGPAQPARPLSPIRAGGFLPWLQNGIDRIRNRVLFESGGYIPQASALTHDGIEARIRDLLGVQDWKHWRPMRPLSDKHDFPRAQNAYWDLLGDYVDTFFKENMDGIREHWDEIRRFSSDLVTHAVPLYLSDADLDALGDDERDLARQRLAWYRRRYALDTDTPRVTIDGELKAVSPITSSDAFVVADVENLKQVCRYAIMMATFMHSFVNENQYDDIGEVMYNSLGLRFGDGEHGIMAPESDTRIAPDPMRATQMMWFSNLLSRTEYGFIVRNEEGDINPMLVNMLKERKEEIEKYGFLVENIESRTNI